MKKYSKPTIFVNDEDSEGVYAASGCYSITVNIHQKPQNGRGDYRIQVMESINQIIPEMHRR